LTTDKPQYVESIPKGVELKSEKEKKEQMKTSRQKEKKQKRAKRTSSIEGHFGLKIGGRIQKLAR
jgi:hypothetical protein